MCEGYHPEIDGLTLCTDDYSAKYISMIDCYILIIVAYANFNMLTKEGHLKAVKRILSYIKTFPKERISIILIE
jgi:hypothetical protein